MMRLVAAVALASMAFPSASPQRFRVTTEAVTVDALVMDGNKPIAGLRASDFEVRDSGILQRIDAVSFEDVPLRVMLALDTSHSLKGQPIEDLKNAAAAVADLLRPEDRVALLTFAEEVKLLTPWTSDHDRVNVAMANVPANGATSLHDAAYAALTFRDEEPGRPLVLLFSDGQDTASWLGGQAVIDAAHRNDAVVYAVGLPAGLVRAPGYRIDFRSGLQPRIPRLPPQILPEPFLNALADETGGSFLTVERSERLRDAFVQIVTEFRTRYLLTYTPRGVDAGGWHPIEVKLKGRRGTVTARRGYLK